MSKPVTKLCQHPGGDDDDDDDNDDDYDDEDNDDDDDDKPALHCRVVGLDRPGTENGLFWTKNLKARQTCFKF